MDLDKLIRRILELVGVIEPRDKIVRRQLMVLNQTKPRGQVTLLLQDIGRKRVSAVAAVRKMTGLNLTDTMTLVEEMLPLPILTHVDEETAELARDLLEAVGARVKIVGAPTPGRERPSTRKPEAVVEPEPDVQTPPADPAPSSPEGEFVVLLNGVGLLPERIHQIVSRLTGWSPAETEATLTDLPQPILIGVDEVTAVRAQQELQMFGAVVDILHWEDYDQGGP